MDSENIANIITIKQKRLQDAENDVRELAMMAEAVIDGDFDIPQLDDLKRMYFPSNKIGETTIHRSARAQRRAYLDSLAQTYIQIFALQREGLALWPYHWMFTKDAGVPKDFYYQHMEEQCQRINQGYDLSTYHVAEAQRNRIDITKLAQLLDISASFDHAAYLKSRIKSEYEFRCFSGLFFEQTFETLMSQIEMQLILQKTSFAALLCVRDRRIGLGLSFNALAIVRQDKSFDTSDRACTAYGKKLLGRLRNFKSLFGNAADTIEGYREATEAMLRCKPPHARTPANLHPNTP